MSLSLTEEARSTLAALARSRTAPAHHVERSAIILHLADRRGASEIAATLDIDRQRVTRCARRVTAVGPLRAIDDLPRSGRPPDITAAARTWLIGEACARPKDRGYPHELWTLRLLTAHARSHGCRAGHASLIKLAASTVHDILNSQPVKPHKVRYYLERRDPAFDERKAEVLEVYAAAEMLQALPQAELPVVVVSYDEKPGIQAIAATAPDLPPRSGKYATVQRDHEYKRLGTVTLSAAVDLVTGFVHHAVTQRHRSREFIAFLQQLDVAYPARLLICILLDNHSAHRSRETRRFLESKPGRFELVFTPTHASWLNWVEIFFSKMTRSVLRRIRVASKDELTGRIKHYIELCNDLPIVPKWSYGINRDTQPLAA
ncbi:MAG TPA: IS630 family transposase [Pirellulales bacterium]|jgi:transposase|nr:IS630 family transposase [Pirellulales bacterium]